MKKIICYILSLVMMLSLSACGTDAKNSESKTKSSQSFQDETYADNKDLGEKSAEIDVDLTKLSSTMIYSEVYNMMENPEDYLGKIIKMNGQFSVYQDQSTGNIYYAVVIADATACCSQGLEFVLAGDHNYPDDYPEIGTEVTVTGNFQTYDEDGRLYCHLIDAEMI